MLRLHKHNKETYERLTQLFVCNDRVAVVQPTGTGKSFIILKLISDNVDKKFLVLSPSVYIVKQIQTHAENNNISLDNVDFITIVINGSLLRGNSNSPLVLLVTRIHNQGLRHFGLVIAKSMRLF